MSRTLPPTRALPAVVLLLALRPPCAYSTGPLSEVRIEIDLNTSAGPLKPLFRDFAEGGESSDADYLEGLIDEMRVLRPRIVRFDNAVVGLTRIEETPDGLAFDFALFDKAVSVIREMGAEPLVCLSYTPPALSGDGSTISPPKDLDAWADLVYSLVRHANSDPARRIEYWEVWNEPNHRGFWSGTLEEYLELYERTARAVVRADPAARVGGGGFAGFDERWVDGLLEFVADRDLPLRFLSWHMYHVSPDEYARTANRAKENLAHYGLDAELVLDEWNYYAGMTPENDNHVGATYVSEALRRMIDTPLDYAPFFEPKDGWSPEGEYYGRWGMFTFTEKPKANYYAFEAWSRLAARRVELRTDDPGVDGVATRDGSRAVAVIHNRGEACTARLRFEGCEGDGCLLTRWLVDGTHSNPVRGTPHELERVERATLFAEGGTAARSLILPASSVSLVELRPDPDAVPTILEPALSPGSPLPSIPAPVEFRFAAREGGNFEIRTFSERPGDRISLGESQLAGPAPASRVVNWKPALTGWDGWRFLGLHVEARDGSRRHFLESLAYQVPSQVSYTIPARRVLARPGETLRVELESHDSDPVEGETRWEAEDSVRIATPSEPFVIGPKGSGAVVTGFTASGTLSRAAPVTCRIAGKDGYTLSDRCWVVPFIKAHSDESASPTSFVLPRFSYQEYQAVPDGTLEASVGASWDEKALTVTVSVVDEVHLQEKAPGEMWAQDSIQVAFDAGFDARLGEGYDGNDFEYGAALIDGAPATWCWVRKGAIDPGPAEGVSARTLRAGDRTNYRVRIPWASLAPFEPAEGRALGFSLLVNDDDGEGRFVAPLFGDISGPKEPEYIGAILLGE